MVFDMAFTFAWYSWYKSASKYNRAFVTWLDDHGRVPLSVPPRRACGPREEGGSALLAFTWAKRSFILPLYDLTVDSILFQQGRGYRRYQCGK